MGAPILCHLRFVPELSVLRLFCSSVISQFMSIFVSEPDADVRIGSRVTK